jgi:hypothetical protein
MIEDKLLMISVDKKKFLFSHSRCFCSGDGRGLGSGFYQAMFLTKIGATININSTFTCFYQPFNLVDFLCEYLQHDIIRDGNEISSLIENYFFSIIKVLMNVNNSYYYEKF